jgi:hypothetical protein
VSIYGLPAHVIHDLDQQHAAADGRLNDLLVALAADGIADLAAPERAIGVGLELANLDGPGLLEIAAAAVARLLEEIAGRCRRCAGDGTVYVTIYGGHTVDCGMCRGTGKNGTEQ